MATKLKITQVRSIIGSQKDKHKVVMESLGFRRNYGTLYKNDSPQIRGMLNKVRHLVTWEEINEKDVPEKKVGSAGFTVIEAGSGGRSVKGNKEGDRPDGTV